MKPGLFNRQAFDSAPYSLVDKRTELVGASSEIVRFSTLSTERWNTTLQLKTKQEVVQSRAIKICRGIFQGDFLSPLLFSIALIPLTELTVDIKYMQLRGK